MNLERRILNALEERGPLFVTDIIKEVGLRLLTNEPPLPAIPDDIKATVWRMVDNRQISFGFDGRISLISARKNK